MKVKVGDKVYCHTEYSVYIWRKSFSKGNIYIIDTVNIIDSEIWVWMFDDFGSQVSICYDNKFDKYFYTDKELRRKKLEKLRNVFNSNEV